MVAYLLNEMYVFILCMYAIETEINNKPLFAKLMKMPLCFTSKVSQVCAPVNWALCA